MLTCPLGLPLLRHIAGSHDPGRTSTPSPCVRATQLPRGHTLVMPRQHVAGIFDLGSTEQAALWRLVSKVRDQVQADLHPDAFTVGLNDGVDALGVGLLRLSGRADCTTRTRSCDSAMGRRRARSARRRAVSDTRQGRLLDGVTKRLLPGISLAMWRGQSTEQVPLLRNWTASAARFTKSCSGEIICHR
jgi:hypothetical protein